MSFTPEHSVVLEKYRTHYNTLQTAGFMRNLDEPVKKKLQQIFNEAVGPQRFTLWCGECVTEMVRLLYTHYDAWMAQNAPPLTEAEAMDLPSGVPAADSAATAPKRKRKRR